MSRISYRVVSVVRNLSTIKMRITEDKIYCSAWKFDKKTGAEIDKSLKILELRDYQVFSINDKC